MADETLKCPRCGAPMDLDTVRREARCPACGEHRPIEPTPQENAEDEKARSALGAPPFAIWLTLSGVGIALLMFPVLRWYEHRIQGPQAHREPPRPPSTLVWDVTRQPLFRDLNGDGFADLIGRFRPDEGATATMRVGAFDGRTLQPIWTTESLGEWADGLSTVQLALTGNALLVTDSHGAVELRDATNGGVAKRLAFTGPAQQACADPSGAVRFWAALQGDQGAYVEDTVPQPTPGPRPEWCPPPPPPGIAQPHAHLLAPKSAPAVPGFEPVQVLNEGTDAVAVGLESGLPMLVGFDPSRPGVRWKHPVTLDTQGVRKEAPLGGELVNGVAYIPYQVGASRRLVAVDVHSGQSKWDIAIPGQGTGTATWERIIAAEQRVFVPEPLGLAAFDAQTGKAVGKLGK